MLICIFLIGANVYLMLRNSTMQKSILENHEAIKIIAKDNRSLLNADLMFGKKMASIEKLVMRIESRQEHQTTNTSTSDSTYHQAIALLNRGASVEEVVQQFGLSKAEVNLLDSLKENT